MMTIKKALLTIKGYCMKHLTCDNCPLKADYHCMVEDKIPADWNIDEMINKQRGDNNAVN